VLHGQLIPVREVGPGLVDEWRALAARAIEANPWFEPHVVLPLATLRDDLSLLVAREAHRLRACVVLGSAIRSWHGIGLPMWLTPHPMGTPLVDVEGGAEGLKCAFDFAAASRGPRFLTLQEIDADGAVATLLPAALGSWNFRTQRGESAWPVVRRRSQATYLHETLSGKHRYNVGRLRRRLAERLGSEPRLVDRSGESSAIERFLELEGRGWKGRGGTALACDPRRADYFRAACSRFAEERRLKVYCLEAHATTVAMKVMIAAGEGLIDFRVAYDERFAPFSPGVLLEIDVLSAFHAGDRAWLLSNTNHPTNPVKRIWPDRCATLEVQAERPGLAHRVLDRLVGGLRPRARFTG